MSYECLVKPLEFIKIKKLFSVTLKFVPCHCYENLNIKRVLKMHDNPFFFLTVKLKIFFFVCYQAMYSGLSNKRTLCVYLFPRKILPCAALFHSSEQYYDSPVCLFIFGKIPCPVRLLNSPE